ncbi:unnamed protein product (macronuclear) [Paramecium tetraurelia]|uniref:Transmembrane protein n=1 Tax=Paramecium tetraurelia TaxID=5888 RepID=A0EHT0_PARTE|nr:uncharacterized protein GSPATT00027197001 [Paramecium tetraurelia]CAK94871.1 unnamed protein product [Paramecium tetraurelia]|eukprot:XP_001462244.1 hypothetical protein (macronuclear) [Paramecium tetraurelia strain d4-2]
MRVIKIYINYRSISNQHNTKNFNIILILSFIQESLQLRFPEVDEITYTLRPKQSYSLAIEYICTQQNQGIQQIDLFFLWNQALQTLLKPSYSPVILIYFTTTCSSLLCIRNVFIQFELTPTKQLLTFILVPAIGLFFVYSKIISQILAFVMLCDFIHFASKSLIVGLITSFLILYFQHYMFESAQFQSVFLEALVHQILPCIITIVLLIQVNRPINSSYFYFFALFGQQKFILWFIEHKLINICLYRIFKICLLSFKQSFQFQLQTTILYGNKSNILRLSINIDIHLYQIIGLSLIQSFIFRHGLLNKEQIINIIVNAITQFTGLILFDLLYRYKHNPPFLPLITGFILLGMVLNYLRTGSGLRNPYLEFETMEEKIRVI